MWTCKVLINCKFENTVSTNPAWGYDSGIAETKEFYAFLKKIDSKTGYFWVHFGELLGVKDGCFMHLFLNCGK
jgi:hypothetical protein